MSNNSVGLSNELILNEASKLFAANGYRASSLNDIARNLNVTKPALYYRFKNKHEILNSIFNIIMEIYLKSALEIEKLDIPANEKLDRLIDAHAIAVLNNRDYSTIFFKEANELNEDALQKLKKDMKRYEKIFEKVIEEGIANKKIKDLNSRALVMALFGMTNWLYYWYEENGDLTKEQISELYREILKKGYLVKS